MLATVTLLSCAVCLGQVDDRPRPQPAVPSATSPDARSEQNQQWLLSLRLKRSQEITYRGVFDEKSSGGGIHFERRYRFHNRLFVLNAAKDEYDLAFLTTHRTWVDARLAKDKKSESRSLRLQRVQTDRYGRLSKAAGTGIGVPLEGPPTIELGALIELPLTRVTIGRTWLEKEPGRPVRAWQALGTEMVKGERCLKLRGVQKSPDWDKPRGDSTAWRRQDTVWLAPEKGFASRVVRVIEKRLPAREQPSYVSSLRYDLDQNLTFPSRHVEDFHQEILQADRFDRDAEMLLRQPGRHKRELAALATRIDAYVKHQATESPYREAVHQVLHRVRAAARGEVAPKLPIEAAIPTTFQKRKARLGQPAPEFVASYVTSSGLARLENWKGKPVLLVFYHPQSSLMTKTVSFVQRVQESYPKVQVIGLAMTRDEKQVKQQHGKLELKFPVIQGSGLRASYDVEATPKLMLLDADGVVRASAIGWGLETVLEVRRALHQWASKKQETRSSYGPRE